MSTDDVIELGSSDDEKEPLTKKIKKSNTVVHIPKKCTILPGVTIKPTHGVIAKVNQERNIKGKIILETKNYSANKMKIGNVPSNILINPKINARINSNFSNKSKSLGTRILTKLPAGITVTKASNSIRKNPLHILNSKKTIVKSIPVVTPTVELDDEDSPSASMPQWYKRPEDESMKNEDQNLCKNNIQSMEEQNNKEPELPRYIEITIEDSPLKPDQTQNNVSAIVIEDSPVKAVSEMKNSNVIEKQSRKKLDYPKKKEIESKEMIEIEVDLIENNTLQSDNNSKVCLPNRLNSVKEVCNTNKENDNVPERNTNEGNSSTLPVPNQEFHPIYQKFIDTCFQIENSGDMKKIVEKKIKAYYRQCSKEYVVSEEFIDFVTGKVMAIEASPDKMYLYIKDVVDELNMQRKLAKASVAKEEVAPEAATEEYIVDQDECDSKRQRQIKKLEKTLKKLHRAIQKLEEQEVDFDDEGDSVYLLTERYKERLVKVHAKFCQLTNSKMPSEPYIKLETPPGHCLAATKKLEKFINKKVPIGAPLPFPDFHDVVQCVREANKEDNLHLNEMEIDIEARDLFSRCGKKLQRRRQENEWRIAAARLPVNEDPAEKDESLKKVLENNTKLATKRESEVFKKFVDRQVQLKLEAEEIGDKEAEESLTGSEEEIEETDQSNLLESKEKRKKRLKRLLQEKSKLDVEKSIEQVGELENNKIEGENKVDRISDVEENNESELITVSDGDNSGIESDIDELHLLQKLYSASEVDSSESPISLSDSDNEKEQCAKGITFGASDYISIENSSYSESENNADEISGNIDEEDRNNFGSQDSTGPVEHISIKEIKEVDVESHNGEKDFVNYCEIDTSLIPVKNVNEIISKEIPSAKEAIGDEVDENRLLESSDDDNNAIKIKGQPQLSIDNISPSKVTICSCESNESVMKKAAPSDQDEKVTSVNKFNENLKENIAQINDTTPEVSVPEIVSPQPINL